MSRLLHITGCGLRLAAHTFVVVGCLVLAGASNAQQTSNSSIANFGGPDAVGNQIKEDRATASDRLQQPTKPDIRQRLEAEYGLSFGLDYLALYLGATESLGANDGASGIARIYGSWELTGRDTADTGALIFKGEHRHAYTGTAPSGLGFATGYVGLYNPVFSDQGLRLTNLYWRQRFGEGRGTITAGFLDVTDYLDAYALASPFTGFGNLVFSTGSATIGLPNDATLGIAGGIMVTDNIYAIAGITDANADPTHPFRGFSQVFDESQFFKSLELGWTPSKERLILDNIHATIWHTDGSSALAMPAGWGISFSATRFVNDQWHLFLRGGFAEDGGTLLEASVGSGFGYVVNDRGDLFAAGLNWGRPNVSTFGPGLRNQVTSEVFYRWQATSALAVTFDAQFVSNPALNPEVDSLAVFGVRGRLAF